MYYKYVADWNLGTYGGFFSIEGQEEQPTKIEYEGITPDLDTGDAATPIRVVDKTCVQAPSGYRLIGWMPDHVNGQPPTEADAIGIDSEEDIFLTDSTTFTAIWEQGREIVFDEMGGSGGAQRIHASRKSSEGSWDGAALPAQVDAPERGGYAFNGYYEKVYDSDPRFGDVQGTEVTDGSGTYRKNYWYQGDTVGDASHSSVPCNLTNANIPDDFSGEDTLTLYADWVKDIALDAQGGSPEQKVHVSWDAPLPTEAISSGECAAEGPAEHGTVPLAIPERAGYEFTGYWNTRHAESGTEVVDGEEVQAKRYYVADGTALKPVDGQVWDTDQGTLYAHWKYRIYLSTNAVDSSGNAVAAADAGSIDPASVAEGTLLIDDRSTPDDATDDRIYLEAIDGAAIQLPQVTGRVGYLDSGAGTDGSTPVNARAWGVRCGSYGWATGIVPLGDDGTTAGDPTELPLDTSNIAATRSYDSEDYFASKDAGAVAFPKPTEDSGKSITLYLNWENRAKTYDGVKLVSAYDGFAASNEPTTTVNAVYDAPLLMERDGSAIVYADFLKDGSANGIVAPMKVVGEGSELHHEYVFKGFRTERNELDGTRGDELIGSAITGTGSDITVSAASVATPFRIDAETPELFAAWGRVKSTLTLDLNGGAIAGLSGGVFEVMEGDREFTLTAGAPVPSLPGAYATAPVRAGYEFKGYYTEATGAGSAFPHYAEDGTNRAFFTPGSGADEGKAVPVGADWDFYTDTTLYAHWEYVIDFKLDHGTDCASNPEGVHAAMSLMTVPVVEDTPDRYGNRYPTGAAATSTSSLRVRALYGVPVMVPVAQNRNGFHDTFTWQVREGDRPDGAARAAAMGDEDDGYFTSATIDGTTAPAAPFAGIAPNGSTRTITAWVDWTDREKTYWARIVPDRTDEGSLGGAITGAEPELLKVRFNEAFPVFEDGSALSVLPRDTDESRNLVFQGVFAVPGAIGDAAGARYVDADGAPADAFAPKARADGFRIDDALVESEGESAPVYGTHPIEVYARWAYPSCEVSFDLNTGSIAGAGSVDDAFELKTNDELPDLNDLPDTVAPDVRAALATKPVKYASDKTTGASDYLFDGYWSEPYGGDQYFTADLAPTPGAIWDFAGPRTLYAHWRYTVRMELNGSVPAGLQDACIDGLLVSKANDHADEPAPQPVSAPDAPDGAYTLDVVWGAAATLPASVANVQRQRFEKPYREDAPIVVANDYLFGGWLMDADDAEAAFTADTPLGGDGKDALLPFEGTATLFASWERDPYRVTLDPKGGDGSLADSAFAPDEAGGHAFGTTELTDVLFDEPVCELGREMPAPHRLGYRFLGYYDAPGGEGLRYLSPGADGTTMGASGELWRHHEATGVGGVTLYAHYERLSYRIDFKVSSPNESETNPVRPVTVGSVASVHYGDALVNFTDEARKLTCEGYAFGGWQADDGTLLFDGEGTGLGSFAFERNLELSPVWEPRTVQVVWDANWPAGAVPAPTTSNEVYGQPYQGGADPAVGPAGYRFEGWFRDGNDPSSRIDVTGAFRPSKSDLAGASITYSARWTAIPYKVVLLPGENGTYAKQVGLDPDVVSDGNGGYRYEHAYTVAEGDWSLRRPDPLHGFSPAGWEQVRAVDDGSGGITWEVVSRNAPGYVNVASFGGESELVFRAKWTATEVSVELRLNGAPPSALGGAPDTYLYGIGMPVELPSALKWPGHTFLGWHLVKVGSKDIEPVGDPEKNVVVSVPDSPDAEPEPLVYEAAWAEDSYTISFVMSPTMDAPIANATDGLAYGSQLVFPVPSFRGAFPAPDGGYAEGTQVAEHSASRIFRCYRIKMDGGTGAVASFYPNDPATPKTVGELLERYPGIRDTRGEEVHDGSTIEFYGHWETAYSVDVPLRVGMAFDADSPRMEDSLTVTPAALRITSASTTERVEVASLLCDPVAAAGNGSLMPGTVGAFDDATGCSRAYLQVAARQGSQGEPSPSERTPVEFNLGTVAAEGGVSVSSVAEGEGEGQVVRSLSEMGFSFGGVTSDERTLNLLFGLRFDEGFDPRTLAFLNDPAFKDSGREVPIAKVYCTLAMARVEGGA